MLLRIVVSTTSVVTSLIQLNEQMILIPLVQHCYRCICVIVITTSSSITAVTFIIASTQSLLSIAIANATPSTNIDKTTNVA